MVNLSIKNIDAQPDRTIVSVDFFDTIVFRMVQHPADVFLLQHAAAGSGTISSMPAADWRQLRMEVEAELCRRSPGGETDLDGIYAALASRLDLTAAETARLTALELSIEEQVIRPYADVVAALDSIAARGFRVVVTTDTYLPDVFIRELLDKWLRCRYSLFCSSATKKTKRSGDAYRLLLEHFPGHEITHFGDNDVSDRQRTRGTGVRGNLTRWHRQTWLETQRPWLDYRRAAGFLTSATPADTPIEPDAVSGATLPWRWSAVLADFLVQLRSYATEVGATDIWFLSRDCEAMFDALQGNGAFFEGIDVRYVYASRLAWYPVLARADAATYERWVGRRVGTPDKRGGDLSIRYLNEQVTASTRKVVMVDVGWKGRMQVALRAALPASVDVLGYYVALSPDKEAAVAGASRTFVDWDQSVCLQPLIEGLMGYAGRSCTGFAEDASGTVGPIFTERSDDRAPAAYCEALRENLRQLLAAHSPLRRQPDLTSRRRSAIRSLCHLPDEYTLEAVRGWSIGRKMDGTETTSLVPAGGPVAERLMGKVTDTNIWPPGGVQQLVRNPALKKAFILAFYLREVVKVRIKKTAAAGLHVRRKLLSMPSRDTLLKTQDAYGSNRLN